MPIPISPVHYAPTDPNTIQGKADYILDPDAKYHYEYTHEDYNVIQRFKRTETGHIKLVEQLLPSDVKPVQPMQLTDDERLARAAQDAQKEGADISEINIDPKEDLGEAETGYGNVNCDACGFLFSSKEDLDSHDCKPIPQAEEKPVKAKVKGKK